MEDDLVARIAANPQYKQLKRRRDRFGWTLAVLMLAAYYGFVLLVAFDKEFLARRMGEGVMTLGMPIGFGVIALHRGHHRVYVRRANAEFDTLSDAVVRPCRRWPSLNAHLLRMRSAAVLPALGASRRLPCGWRRPGPAPAAAHQLDRHRHVRAVRGGQRSSSPSGPRRDAHRQPTSTPPAAASPASRTAWRSRATTCRRPRSSAFRPR